MLVLYTQSTPLVCREAILHHACALTDKGSALRGALCQGGIADCRAFTYKVEEIW